MPSYSGIVGEDVPRLDRYVAEYIRLLNRSQIKSRALDIRLNGKPVKRSRPVKAGDLLEFSWAEAPPVDILPEPIPLEILYEDSRVVVVNKAHGMVVHPGAGNPGGTLANALLYRMLARDGTGRPRPGLRPGIVHRLDRDTSGVIIAAYDDEALVFLADQFKARTVRKSYGALVRGVPGDSRGVIETRILRDSRDRKRFTVSAEKGRTALTLYRVIRSWGAYSLVLLRPRTGRTHQLRVHMRHLGHPILGDPLYGSPDPAFPGAGLMLHAKTLSLRLPGEAEPRSFSTPLPGRFRDILERFDRMA
ncbi:MAG: RluA family pseudouridine synthase [Spirochaetaceae bacterium]|nr:RluA family pseudouridine synthase [Spirochaetaceae bacterium]